MSVDPKSTYYDAGGIETISILKAKLTEKQFQGYLLGNALKYLCRLMHKHSKAGQMRDVDKVLHYTRMLADDYKEKNK